MRAADAAVDCLGVGPADDVLILCNEPQRGIARDVAEAAERVARRVRVVGCPAMTRDGQEPPSLAAEAMLNATVIIAATTYSISHTRARLRASAQGARIATMPGITQEIFDRAMPVDYDELKRVGLRIAAALSAASTCRVTSPAGTDVVLSLEGRDAVCDDGDLRAEGAFGNLPAGEAYIAPIETTGDGSIVIDGALSGYGPISDRLRLTLSGGRVVEAHGEGAEWLLETLDSGGPTGRVIAELGIGTNPRATVSGNVLEDEKVVGTAHLAFGTSASYGGANVSDVHIDGVMLRPTVELDGGPIAQPQCGRGQQQGIA